ncbi:MAG: hydrogenase maturation nickel metallochaperone HypA [Candidatus Omnitrophica bacterium]|nr:hydrogenase maturation nickel metallochaperone HypA [Candidatus Omnitrophota bacterium]MDD5654824.1 hydrogenase maturation nickel metallochaperone HypA [Candidatus Omnitrophota bacterium]
MHDLTYANSIINALKGRLEEKDFKKKITVNVALGPFTHVTPDTLRAAFSALSEKEDLKNVKLNIKMNKAVMECRSCGVKSEISHPTTECPACGKSNFSISNIEEFVIQSIEI